VVARNIGSPEWTKYKRGDRVILTGDYHGFPQNTAGTVLGVYYYLIEVLFDGEDHYRVLPFSMVTHASQDEMQSANACGTVQGQTHEAMEVSAPHSFKSDEQVQRGEVLSLR